MRKIFGNSSTKKHPEKEQSKSESSKIVHPKKDRSLYKRYMPYICLVAVGVFFIAAGVRELLAWERDDNAARAEYLQLQDDFAERSTPSTMTPVFDPADESEEYIEDDEDEEVEGYPTLDELSKMNRDFIGWMSIKDILEYPVVQGRDNDKYVNTTFGGSQNTAGAIFMDYRHTNGFSEKVCIIYGHHTRDGTMFAPLAKYLDSTFLKNNPNLTITKPDGTYLSYRIFAARLTDAWDVAYSVGVNESARAAEVFPNAPANASHYLVLSTCTRSPDKDERIIVFAASVD